MADYVIIRRGRNILSTILHVLLNLILAIATIFLNLATASFLPGCVLVLLSKWRMFAVRPRYLFINIKSNLVDLIMGFSFVFLAYCAGNILSPLHYVLTALYSLWLIVLKPMSSNFATKLQALLAVFFGSTAITLMVASSSSGLTVLLNFILGFAVARHVLVQSEDTEYSLITLISGLIFAEISWLAEFWLIVYSFKAFGLIIPQISIILTILAFLAGLLYQNASQNDQKIEKKDILIPTIFAISVILIIVLWFSKPLFNV